MTRLARSAQRSRVAPVVTAFGLLVCGCAREKMSLARVPEGDVVTSGVTIRAVDGSFQYTQGSPFPTPWTAENCPAMPTPRNYDLAPGAKPVVIRHPLARWRVHGLLAFCPVPAGTDEPNARSHGIEIDPARIEAATHGQVSVTWGMVGRSWNYVDDDGEPLTLEEWPSWILWLSDRPIR